jgi:hypothetical protein
MGGVTATQAFFQLAVAAIPALLFGGAVLEARQGDRSAGKLRDGERVFVGALVLLVVLAAPAELIAVRGAVDDSTGGLWLDFVAFVLCAGTLALVVNVVAPWSVALFPRLRRSDRGGSRTAALLVASGLGAAAAVLLIWVHAGVGRAELSQNVGVAFTGFATATGSQSAAYVQSVAARESALTFVNEHAWAFPARKAARLEAEVDVLVGRVDHLAFKAKEATGDRESEIATDSEGTVEQLERELGKGTPPTALLTMVVNDVKATGVAYVKAEQAKSTTKKALSNACAGGRDPRCDKKVIAALSD